MKKKTVKKKEPETKSKSWARINSAVQSKAIQTVAGSVFSQKETPKAYVLAAMYSHGIGVSVHGEDSDIVRMLKQSALSIIEN